MNFKTGLINLSRDELLREVRKRAATENEATLALIECLREIDSRRLYLELGFNSLHEFAIRDLGLSEGAAHRRISAARLMALIPEVKPALEEGKLNLSTLSLAFKKKLYSVPEKKEILKELESVSKREVERKLAALCPEEPKPDQIRVLSETHSELKLCVTQAMLAKLGRLKELLAHTRSQASPSELLEHALDLALSKLDPEARKTVSPPPEKATKNIRYIPSHLKILIWKRAHGRCEYVSALGGTTAEGNLRLLCSRHNAFEAERVLGRGVMARYQAVTQGRMRELL